MLLQNCFQPIAQTCRSAKFFGQNVWSTLGLQGGWRQNWKMAAIIHCTLLILYNQVREDYFDDIFEARRPITNIPSHDERIVRCLQLWSFVRVLSFYFFFTIVISNLTDCKCSGWFFLLIYLVHLIQTTNMNLQFLQRSFCFFTFWGFLKGKSFNWGQNTHKMPIDLSI